MNEVVANPSMTPVAAPPMPAQPQYSAAPAPVQNYGQPAAPAGDAKPSAFDFLNGINWMEVGFMFLGALALYSTIYYHRRKLKEDKTALQDVQRRLDKQDQRLTTHDSDLAYFAEVVGGSPTMMTVN